MNEPLIEMLGDEPNVRTLIEYVVRGKPEGAVLPTRNSIDEDGGGSDGEGEETYQPSEEETLASFAYMACEVICCDVRSVLGTIMRSPELLSQIFSVVDVSLDDKNAAKAEGMSSLPMRLGYILKILTTLVKQGGESIIVFVSKHEGGKILQRLLDNIDSYTVACIQAPRPRLAGDPGDCPGCRRSGNGANDNDDTGSLVGVGDEENGKGSIRRFGSVVETSSDGDDEPGGGYEFTPEDLVHAQELWLGDNGLAVSFVAIL